MELLINIQLGMIALSAYLLILHNSAFHIWSYKLRLSPLLTSRKYDEVLDCMEKVDENFKFV